MTLKTTRELVLPAVPGQEEGIKDAERVLRWRKAHLQALRDQHEDIYEDLREIADGYAKLAGRPGGQTLHGGVAAGEVLVLKSTSHTTKGKIYFGLVSVYDEANGRLGIGTYTPSYQLQLTQDSAAKPNTNTWTIASDERLKENIQPADLNRCYEIVKTLPLKSFKWRDDVYTTEQVRDRNKLGWTSQDVQPIFPKSVEPKPFVVKRKEIDKEGKEIEKEVVLYEDCLNLNTDQIYAVMYGAIQLLIQKVEALENKVYGTSGKSS